MNSSRRQFLKLSAATGAALGASRLALAGGPAPAAVAMRNPLPRWRGFNLQYLFNPRRISRPDEDHFRWISDWGFDFVRLPMSYRTWLKRKLAPGERLLAEDAREVDDQVLSWVDDAVEFGARHGVHVCLCFHHAPGYRVGKIIQEPFLLWRDQAAVDALAFHWGMFARRYRGVAASKISFNLFNEAPWPTDGFNGEIYRRAILPAVEAIRRVSADRLIIADGMGAGNLPVPELVPLGIHQSVHCYIPGNISHYKVDWKKDRTDWPEPRWPGGTDDAGYIWDRSRLEAYYTPWKNLIAQGVGVHMGETGGSSNLAAPIFTAWLTDVLALCREFNVGYALWDFIGGGKFGILDTERADVTYEDWHGHKLDRKLLTLLQQS